MYVPVFTEIFCTGHNGGLCKRIDVAASNKIRRNKT
jgi:hypothetical protein